MLEDDDERYTIRRRKMYAFMKIPLELETFMCYGFLHCLDSFLFVLTFLPLRFISSLILVSKRIVLTFLGLKSCPSSRTCLPSETIDILRGVIIIICVYLMSFLDTSMMYHIIKSQSVIKLYVFYNMLEVGDRLFSAFGQDTIDTLFWTATEPQNSKCQHIGFMPHALLALVYVFLHTLLILFQATTLNVAINASNKALLTIMMSNNFVELKSSVFKKFDKKNLFQVSCSDVRERFHLFSLLFVVVVQTMKEYGWKEDCFWSLTPECLLIMGVELMVDWIKHAFITRFNEVSTDVYRDYTTSLAYDLAQSKQKNASSDHCDLISRRMGFIPLPFGVVMIRVIGSAVKIHSNGALVVFLTAYLTLLCCRVLTLILIHGKACDLIEEHKNKMHKNYVFELSELSTPTPKVDQNVIEEKDKTYPCILQRGQNERVFAISEESIEISKIDEDDFELHDSSKDETQCQKAAASTLFVKNRSISTPDLIKRNVDEWPTSAVNDDNF